MTCKQINDHVTDYIEGALSPWLSHRFGMHVASCQLCRIYLVQMKLTMSALKELPADPVPDIVRDELFVRFRKAYPQRRDATRRRSVGLRFLVRLERAVGGSRGWAISLLLFAAAVTAILLGGLHDGPLERNSNCLAIEIGAGLLPVVAMAIIALTQGARLSTPTLVTLSAGGSALGLGLLAATCPLAHAAPHVLTLHLGGMAVAAFATVVSNQIPTVR